MCRVGRGHQHQLAHRCLPNWDMGMGHLWLNGWDIYHLKGGAFYGFNGLGIYGLMGWIKGLGIYNLMGGTFII